MVISEDDLRRWKRNSLSLASKLGYDSTILDLMSSRVYLGVIPRHPGKNDIGAWYGFCRYALTERKQVVIEVYQENFSTDPPQIVEAELQAIGMPQRAVEIVMDVYKQIPQEAFAEMFNQSGMDHELIGHAYHFFKGEDCGEENAVKTQIQFAKARNWKTIEQVMPLVLGYLKGIDSLK